MICGKCQLEWCWQCGKPIDENHSDFTCLTGSQFFNLNWYIIALIIFFPILFPFALGLMAILSAYIAEMDDIRDDKFLQFLMNHKFFTITLFFILSVPLIALGLSLGLIIVGFAVSIELAPYKHNQNLLWGVFLLVFIFGVAGIVMALLIITFVLLYILTPIVGIALLFLKIGYQTYRLF